MRGGEQYKKRFTNQTTENVRVVVFTSALDYLRLRFRQVVKNVSLARTIHQFLMGRKSVATTTTVHTGQKREYECSTLRPLPEIGTRNIVKKLGGESIGRICSFLGLEADSERHLQIEKRFETGANCFVFEKQDRIAAIVWTKETKESKETEAGSLLTVLFDFETSEATDGEACHISLVAEVAKIVLEQGRRIVALAHDDETAFLKALTSVGFEISAESLMKRL
jgi:hypothetical protein